MNVAGCIINEDATTTIHYDLVCLAWASEQSTLCRANKMIDRNSLPLGQVILPKYSFLVSNNTAPLSWGTPALLLSKLACCTLWEFS